jgi:2-polyprenyl-3-methyl-5-hydroxy-6-metoxy-1,4-benzoquinol methylase
MGYNAPMTTTATAPASVGDAEFHLCEVGPPTPEFEADWFRRFGHHLHGGPVLDIGCGEGHQLEALGRRGVAAEGVDLTPELVERARARGLTVACEDALGFVRRRGGDFKVFLLMDFVEHVPFDVTAALLDALPRGARCLIQTPNTNSVVGHQFYLQVPGHVTPLSPATLRQMFARKGLRVVEEGTTSYGALPWTGLRRRVTEWVLVKLLGLVTARLLIEGADYYVIAEKQ